MAEHHISYRRLKEMTNTGAGCREMAHLLRCDHCLGHLEDHYHKAGRFEAKNPHHTNCRCSKCREENQPYWKQEQHRRNKVCEEDQGMDFDQKLNEMANKLARDFMDYFKHAYGQPHMLHDIQQRLEGHSSGLKRHGRQIKELVRKAEAKDDRLMQALEEFKRLKGQVLQHVPRIDRLWDKFGHLDQTIKLILSQISIDQERFDKSVKGGQKLGESLCNIVPRVGELEQKIEGMNLCSCPAPMTAELPAIYDRLEKLEADKRVIADIPELNVKVDMHAKRFTRLENRLNKTLGEETTDRLEANSGDLSELFERIEKLEKGSEYNAHYDARGREELLDRIEKLEKKAHHVPEEFVQRTQQALKLTSRVELLEQHTNTQLTTLHARIDQLESFGDVVDDVNHLGQRIANLAGSKGDIADTNDLLDRMEKIELWKTQCEMGAQDTSSYRGVFSNKLEQLRLRVSMLEDNQDDESLSQKFADIYLRINELDNWRQHANTKFDTVNAMLGTQREQIERVDKLEHALHDRKAVETLDADHLTKRIEKLKEDNRSIHNILVELRQDDARIRNTIAEKIDSRNHTQLKERLEASVSHILQAISGIEESRDSHRSFIDANQEAINQQLERLQKLEKSLEDFSYGDIERLFEGSKFLTRRIEELEKQIKLQDEIDVPKRSAIANLIARVEILEQSMRAPGERPVIHAQTINVTMSDAPTEEEQEEHDG